MLSTCAAGGAATGAGAASGKGNGRYVAHPASDASTTPDSTRAILGLFMFDPIAATKARHFQENLEITIAIES
jgi:hypothetical protein